MKTEKFKYKLVVNYVLDSIYEGKLKKGDWIPSLNEFRKMYGLSRDTVFAGIKELKSKGIIESNPGKGYYVESTRINYQHNILLLFNELNEFKEDIYNSFMASVNKSATVDIFFHNYNRRVFETLLNDANGTYTTYVVMPGKFVDLDPLLQNLSGRVYLLDHYHPELKGKYTSVAQDFEKDTYEALIYGLPHLRKYNHILMVQKEAKEPIERFYGLQKFGREYHFDCEYLPDIQNRPINRGEVFMVVSDRDLVVLLKQADRQHFVPGRDFGIISYNDTPLKEILAGGITTLSTDFKLMGKTMAQLINKKGIETVENPWNLNVRKSL